MIESQNWIDFIKNFLHYDAESPLIFTGLVFWVFFALVLLGYSVVYKTRTLRNAFLFLVSLFFYYKTSGWFFSILLFSTFSDYLIGFFIAKNEGLRKKLWLTLSIVLNLGVLIYFKYAYFFADSFNAIFGSQYHPINHFAAWTNTAFHTGFRVDRILLPVGISFFTFQTMSYAIDIYRDRIKPVRNLLDFGFYVSFFPQLVAGPIVRAADFIPQLYKPYQLTKTQFGTALFWILNGLIKKLFLADYLAVNFIDRVFQSPANFTGFENLMALYGYSLQVYADFSGYTDMAIGIALLMGFDLPKNFDSPYKADNCGNFWKRWHISLSSWLKDYLYIPLGGNRGGSFGTWAVLSAIVLLVSALAGNYWIFIAYIGLALSTTALAQIFPKFKFWLSTNINVMLTMLLGGLWHGASWNFVIWGGLNGIGIVTYKAWRKISPWESKNRWWKKLIAIFITFHFITFTRIWFRSGSHNTWGNLNDKHDILAEFFSAKTMLRKIFVEIDFGIAREVVLAFSGVFGVMALGYLIHWLPSSIKNWYRLKFIEAPLPIKILASFVAIVFIYQVISADMQPFIYFQF